MGFLLVFLLIVGSASNNREDVSILHHCGVVRDAKIETSPLDFYKVMFSVPKESINNYPFRGGSLANARFSDMLL
jgi:hypothetical protein